MAPATARDRQHPTATAERWTSKSSAASLAPSVSGIARTKLFLKSKLSAVLWAAAVVHDRLPEEKRKSPNVLRSSSGVDKPLPSEEYDRLSRLATTKRGHVSGALYHYDHPGFDPFDGTWKVLEAGKDHRIWLNEGDGEPHSKLLVLRDQHEFAGKAAQVLYPARPAPRARAV